MRLNPKKYFVRRLEKMLDTYDDTEEGVCSACPGTRNFSGSKIPNWRSMEFGLAEWCYICMDFMSVPEEAWIYRTRNGGMRCCPCQYYGSEDAIPIARKKIREYRESKMLYRMWKFIRKYLFWRNIGDAT